MALFKSKSIPLHSCSETTVYIPIQKGKLGWDEAGTRSLPSLERGKYSFLNAVPLWDDLHSTLTSLTNKLIPSKLSSIRNNLPWVNQKLKRIARQRDRAFQKHRKSGKPADRKKCLDLKHLFRKSIKCSSYQSYLEDILDVASNDLTSKPYTKKTLNTYQTIQTRFCLCYTSTHTILSIRTTPWKPLFLTNSSTLC